MPEKYPTRTTVTFSEMARAHQELKQLLAQEKSGPFATLETSGETAVIRLRAIPRSSESSLANSQFEDQLMKSLETLLNQVAAGTSREVVVDLAAIDHPPKWIFGQLVALNKKLKEKQRSLRIINASALTYEVLHTTRIDTIIPTTAHAPESEPDTVDA